MSYTSRVGTSAVVNNQTGKIIGPENATEWQEYQAWLNAGNFPLSNTTINSNSLSSYAAAVRDTVLSKGIIVNVSTVSGVVKNVLSDGEDSTRTDLLGLYISALASNTFTTNWVDNNNNTTTITSAEVMILSSAVRTWYSNIITAYSNILSKIGEGVIVSSAGIDNFTWPTS